MKKHIPKVAVRAGSNLAGNGGRLPLNRISRVKNAWVRTYPSNTQIVAPNIQIVTPNIPIKRGYRSCAVSPDRQVVLLQDDRDQDLIGPGAGYGISCTTASPRTARWR